MNFDMLASLLPENPIYASKSLRRTSTWTWSVALASLATTLFYVGPWLMGSLYGLLSGFTLSFSSMLASLPTALFRCAPALLLAATIRRERDRGTWDSLLLTPYSRRDLLLGLAAARMEPFARALALALPGCLLTGYQIFGGPGGVWLGTAAPSLASRLAHAGSFALLQWLALVSGCAFSAIAGTYAASSARTTSGAIALTIVLVVLVRPAVGCSGGLFLLPIQFLSADNRTFLMTTAASLVQIVIDAIMAWLLLNGAARELERDPSL